MLALAPLANAFSLSEIITPSGTQLEVNYDPGTNQIVIRALLEAQIWFGIGFGTMMKNTPMIVFQATGATGIVTDRYSYGHDEPTIDPHQNL